MSKAETGLVIKHVLYECPFCHTMYKAEGDAELCQLCHKVPVKIEKQSILAPKYHSRKNGNADYPDYLYITFDNGKSIRYKKG